MEVRSIAFKPILAMAAVVAAAAPGASQSQPQGRIVQQIVVNGQPATGAYVQSASGGLQSYKCANPQQYTTPGGGMKGWACYDAASGMYLLNAQPPEPQAAAAPVPAPSPLPAPAPLPANPPQVVYGPYGYPRVVARPAIGSVKVETKLGSVYVDGGFVGSVKKHKKFSLVAGNHEIEVRDTAGHTVFKEKVQVLPRRTVDIKTAS